LNGRVVAHRVSMKKESVIIVVIVAFVAGFIAGAIGGIEFYSKEHRNAALGLGPQEENAPRGASEDGIGQLEALVRREPQNLQALISLGNLYFDSHQPQKAIGAYERALAIDPKNPDVRTDLGIMYRETKNYDRAVQEFREAARLDKNHKNSRFNLAIVLQEDKNDFRGAIAAWQDYLRVDPAGERSAMAKAELEQLRNLVK